MKKITMNRIPLSIITLSILCISLGNAEPLKVLIEKGIFLEETKKDYLAAGKVYEQALEQGKFYEILYRIAACNEGLGEDEAQQNLLKAMVENGNAENPWVKKAQGIIKANKKSQEIPQDVIEIRDTLIEATIENDLKLFRSVCNKSMADFMDKSNLGSVSEQIAASLEEGYEMEVKSVEKESFYMVYEWWVTCEDETKFVMNVSIDSKGKVGGCWFR